MMLKLLHLRSYLLLCALNSERLMNLGFAYTILPALRRVHKSREGVKEAASRHLEFFNTHPYLACMIAGAVAREEERVKEGVIKGESVSDFKRSCMGPFGAIGDTLFWATIRPFCSLVCASAHLLHASFLSVPLFLLLYNVPHLLTRCKGLKAGYKLGRGVVFSFTKLPIQQIIESLRSLTLVFCGIIFCRLLWMHPYTHMGWLGRLGCVGISAVTFFALKRGLKKEVLLAFMMLFALLLSFFA